MSDDEADPELLAFLRQHLQGKPIAEEEPETGVLQGAEFVYDHGIDVAIDMRATKNAAESIYQQMQEKSFSTASWSEHELHPKAKDEATVAFIFTMDLLNFSFWSELPDDERFTIEYRGKQWTGYWSLVAAMQRALDESAFPNQSAQSTSHTITQKSPSPIRTSGTARTSATLNRCGTSSALVPKKRCHCYRNASTA